MIPDEPAAPDDPAVPAPEPAPALSLTVDWTGLGYLQVRDHLEVDPAGSVLRRPHVALFPLPDGTGGLFGTTLEPEQATDLASAVDSAAQEPAEASGPPTMTTVASWALGDRSGSIDLPTVRPGATGARAALAARLGDLANACTDAISALECRWSFFGPVSPGATVTVVFTFRSIGRRAVVLQLEPAALLLVADRDGGLTPAWRPDDGQVTDLLGSEGRLLALSGYPCRLEPGRTGRVAVDGRLDLAAGPWSIGALLDLRISTAEPGDDPPLLRDAATRFVGPFADLLVTDAGG